MPGIKYLRGRSKELRGFAEVIGQANDRLTRALVTRIVGGAIRYLTAPIDYRADTAEPPTGRLYDRTIEGDDEDQPNLTATEPTLRTDNPLIWAVECDAVVFHTDHDAATQQLDVEVWAQTDLHTDAGDSASRRIWVLVGTFPVISPYQEYSCQTGNRNVFLRVLNSSGIGGGSPCSLRATVV